MWATTHHAAIYMRNTIIQGDVLDPQTWAGIPDQHVQTCITSPPYWGLRDYGGWKMCVVVGSLDNFVLPKKYPDRWLVRMKVRAAARGGIESPNGLTWIGALGLEDTPERFIAHMVAVFRHVWRVLRDDGTLWLNLGDSYAAGGRGSSDAHRQKIGAATASAQALGRKVPPPGLKPKDLCGIPWRLALALQADGWYLRQDIIWRKPNPMPESCRDRCTKAHEYLFFLTKKPRYFCDMEAVKEPADPANYRYGHGERKYESGGTGLSARTGLQPTQRPTRNKRSVWTIATAPYKEAHFATFPPKLIEPCVLAGTSAKGCCPECGTPWVRIVESERVRTRPGHDSKAYDRTTGKDVDDGLEKPWRDRAEIGNRDPGRHISVTKTIGWEPGCQCGREDVVPCIVFVLFMGSGTTGMVAKQHGRDYLGIELNAEYIEMAEKRIRQAQPPLFR